MAARAVYSIMLFFVATGFSACSPSSVHDGQAGEESPTAIDVGDQVVEKVSAVAPTPLPPPTLPASVTTGTEDERIRAILLQLAAKRRGIDSYTMDITWERREFSKTPVDEATPKGTVVAYGEGTWMEKGDWWRVHRKKRWEKPERPSDPNNVLPDNFTREREPYESWAVYNGQYLAFRFGTFSIELIPQAAIDAGVIRDPDFELFPYPLQWGFGAGRKPYPDMLYDERQDNPALSWRLEELEGPDGPKLKITQITGDKGGWSAHTLDPLRDFLVVQYEAVHWKDGKFLKTAIELQQLADGRWYPANVVKRRPDEVQTFTFANVRFNEPIEDSLFSLDSFDFDRWSTYLNKSGTATQRTKMLYRGGQWVPASLVPREERPKPIIGNRHTTQGK